MPDPHVQLHCPCGTASEHDLSSIAQGVYCPACGRRLIVDALDLLDAPLREQHAATQTPAPFSPGGVIRYASAPTGNPPRNARRLIAGGIGASLAAYRLMHVESTISVSQADAVIILLLLYGLATLLLLAASGLALCNFSRARLMVYWFISAEALSIIAGVVFVTVAFFQRKTDMTWELAFAITNAVFRSGMAVYFWWGLK